MTLVNHAHPFTFHTTINKFLVLKTNCVNFNVMDLSLYSIYIYSTYLAILGMITGEDLVNPWLSCQSTL